MKKAVFLLAVLLLAACGAKPQPSESPAPVKAVEKPDYTEYIEAFSGVVDGAKVTASKAKLVTVRIATDLPSDTAPEEWDTVCDRLLGAYGDLQNVSAQIEAADGSILANSVNGKLIFNAFDRIAFSDNPPTISLDEFNAIQTGMTYKEVVDIVGSSGTQLAHTDLGIGAEYVGDSYQWEGTAVGANAIILFEGGKVVSKSQLLLE